MAVFIAKKSGLFAYPDPAKKALQLKAGKPVSGALPARMLAEMLANGWVEETGEAPEPAKKGLPHLKMPEPETVPMVEPEPEPEKEKPAKKKPAARKRGRPKKDK